MKFLVDMPLPPSLAHWLAARGHDAAHASTLGLDRASDAEILARAAQGMRTVITADLDYPRLLALAAAAGPGLIRFCRGDWSEADVIARMQQLIDNLSDVTRSIIVIERGRPWPTTLLGLRFASPRSASGSIRECIDVAHAPPDRAHELLIWRALLP